MRFQLKVRWLTVFALIFCANSVSGQQPIEVWWQIHAGEDGNGETSQEVGRGIVVHDGTVFVAGTTALLDPNNTANFIRPDPP